jgi:hypothetical protein
VELGELPAERYRPLRPACGRKVVEGSLHPVWRLEHYDRPFDLGCDGSQTFCALAAGPWKEALKAPSLRRKAGNDEGGQGRRRAGHGLYGDPLGKRRTHEARAWVADEGGACVGDNGDGGPSFCSGDSGRGAGGLVIAVVSHEVRAGDGGVAEQLERAPSVLAVDVVGGSQRSDGARGEVAQVADRRCNDHDPAGSADDPAGSARLVCLRR